MHLTDHMILNMISEAGLSGIRLMFGATRGFYTSAQSGIYPPDHARHIPAAFPPSDLLWR